MSEDSVESLWGETGGRRLKPKSRNRDQRLYVRAINEKWVSPDRDVDAVRQRMVDIALESEDHRAAIQAATFVFNAETTVVQAEHAINAGQTVQDTGDEPEPEPIEPD